MVEPFDPNRIPVVMVHGLWSSPTTWMEMFNDLRAFPEIRSRFQFWFFLYPTGQPFWVSAAQLRDTLAEVARDVSIRTVRNPNLDQLVLVGHSMGGLVSMLQTLESGDDFWRLLSRQAARRPAGHARGKGPPRQVVLFSSQSVGQTGRDDRHAAPRQHVCQRSDARTRAGD